MQSVVVVSFGGEWSSAAGGFAAVVRYRVASGRVYARYGAYYRSQAAARDAAAFMADQVRGLAY